MACTAVTLTAFGLICTSTGTIRLIAGLNLLGALAGALWLTHQVRFRALGPAIGLTLAFLVLAGLGLAAVHALNTIPTALATVAATLAAAWISVFWPAPGLAGRAPRPGLPNPLAVAGVLIATVAATVAIHYAAGSATAGADRASSLAVWAYSSGGQLQIGAQQPAGHGAAWLRIVVTQAGITTAAWNNVRLAPGQTWEAHPLALTGNGLVRVVALRGGVVVARLSAWPG
ncbi:MAG: hypothetical protein M3Z75_04230 [Actinomycetota bacterium]|nr:hypothetical protein [Actinomycetota bacterium]